MLCVAVTVAMRTPPKVTLPPKRASIEFAGSPPLAFSFAGILGASLAPYIATWLARTYGLQYVGYYLSAAAVLTLLGLLSIRETKDDDLATWSS